MASLRLSRTDYDEIGIADARLDAEEMSGASGDRLHVLVEKHRAPRPAPRRASASASARLPVESGAAAAAASSSSPEKENMTWKLFRDAFPEPARDHLSQPALVELYRFESGDALLACSARAEPPGACERLADRASRALSGAAGELAGAGGALLALPAAAALAVLGAALRGVRGVVGGCVQSMSDHVLKPALVMTYNAALRPVLVFVRVVGGAVREAVRPVALAGAECAEPVVRLLGAVRLVEVRVGGDCACRSAAPVTL